jgi:CheY-like chemotaxis protein
MSSFGQPIPDFCGMLPMWERKIVCMLSEKAAVPGPAKGLLLCIDDALPVLNVLACVLEEYGYSVLISSDVRHGLRLFQTKEIHLVILDQEMPEMRGHEVAQQMKQIKPAVPIIIHSGSIELPEEVFKVADAVVPKGPSLRALVAEIAQIMATREPRADSFSA